MLFVRCLEEADAQKDWAVNMGASPKHTAAWAAFKVVAKSTLICGPKKLETKQTTSTFRSQQPARIGLTFRAFFPQQCKLMGSSAQISSGVCRCGSQEQVPEEGSGRFRKVPESSGVCYCTVGSGGKFRKVPESYGVCWCRQVP